MLAHFVVIWTLAATPAPAPKTLKLASPGLSVVNLDPKLGVFYSDHIAHHLTIGGVRVITKSEVSALIGLEKQRQLMGCADSSSCITELSNALGVDGVITGSIGKFGSAYQANVKVLSARDGSPLGVYSVRVTGEEELLDELTAMARRLAEEMLRKLNRAPIQAAGIVNDNAASAAPPPEAGPSIAEPAATTAGSTYPLRPPQHRNIVSLQPGGLFFLNFGLEYERVVFSNLTVYVLPQLTLFTVDDYTYSIFGTTENLGFELEFGARLFFSGDAPRGLYASFLALAGFGSRTEGPSATELVQVQGSTLGVGAQLGYAFVFFDRITLAVGLGGGWGIGGWHGGPLYIGRLSTGIAF
jgi:hypothetical protein